MSYFAGNYDIAVISAGHAGIEAGLAAARLGLQLSLIHILSAAPAMPSQSPSVTALPEGEPRALRALP